MQEVLSGQVSLVDVDEKAFLINGNPYQKGSYHFHFTGELMQIEVLYSKLIVSSYKSFNQYLNDDTPFASVEELKTFVQGLFK